MQRRSVAITTLDIVSSQENQMAANITIQKTTAWIRTAETNPALEDTQTVVGLDKHADFRADAPINIQLKISIKAKKSLKENYKS